MGRSQAQLDNLKKGNRFNKETASMYGKMGQPLAVQSRLRNNKLSTIAAAVSQNTIPDDAKSGRKVLERLGVADEDMTSNALIVAGVYKKACEGDTKAVEKWESWQSIGEYESNDATEKALAAMRANFWSNVSTNFAFFNVAAIKHRFTNYVADGGRGSAKSSDISLLGIRIIMENADVNGLVLRKVGNTLRDSVYAQYLWAIGALGVSEYWEAKKNPLDLIYKPTGQRIMFRGADDPMKIKSIKTSVGYIGYTHFEELDQFAGEAEIRNILQSTMRGGNLFWNFESFNPPISRDNWANRYAAHVDERIDSIRHHSTFMELDDPQGWLGDQFINEALLLKERDERAFRHEYGGEAIGTGGNVFENLEIRTITDEEVKRFDRIYQGVDWGWFPDPFAFIRVHYDVARETIYLITEKYENKLSNELSAQWIKDNGFNDTWTTCDSAEPKSIADYRSMGINAKEAVKGPGSVDYGMKWLQKRKIVIDKARTPNAYEEFVNYEYEKNKDDEWMSGYPDANNHLIDALRYALERVYKKFGSKA